MIRNFLILAALAMAISACSNLDMQGVDPKDFYAEHPVKNTVETRHMLYTLDFRVDRNRLTSDAIDDMHSALRDISPEAVESVMVRIAPSQAANEERREHIIKLLRYMGYPRKVVHFESLKGTRAREAHLDIAYAAVVLPHCPDWRTSPYLTYSNTHNANFGCASTVNLGLMVADPRDLEKGTGNVTPDSERNSTVIRNYRSGIVAEPAASSSTGTTEAGTTAEPAQ